MTVSNGLATYADVSGRVARIAPVEAEAPPREEAAALALPATRTTDKWIEETRKVRDELVSAATAAERRATEAVALVKMHQQEAAKLRRTASVFDRLLEQVGDDSVPPASPHERPDRAKWSLKHARCIDCGTTERKHIANGRCTACDGQWRKNRGA